MSTHGAWERRQHTDQVWLFRLDQLPEFRTNGCTSRNALHAVHMDSMYFPIAIDHGHHYQFSCAPAACACTCCARLGLAAALALLSDAKSYLALVLMHLLARSRSPEAGPSYITYHFGHMGPGFLMFI
eukprot:365424-Chlamydomonas_euryale.AAC.25